MPRSTTSRDSASRARFRTCGSFRSSRRSENIVFALSTASPERSRRAPRADICATARFATLVDLGLDASRGSAGRHLSYAQQKMLMMGTVFARHDPIVFLDEIAAGLDHTSVHAFVRAPHPAAGGIGPRPSVSSSTISSLVWEAADTVVVLDAGRVVTAGPPAAIQADPRVVEIYFGQSSTVSRP